VVVTDAGGSVDAPVGVDVMTGDGGAVDAPVGVDATTADAGAVTDVGTAPPADDGGCSVSGAPRAKGSPTAFGALGLVLGAVVARRRRR
jgi:MYXO-CTERM domain-containing protein